MSHAETLKTSIGSFEVPDGMTILDRDEKPNAKTGMPSGLIVMAHTSAAPRSIFIVTWEHVTPGEAAADLRLTAVKVGNPFNKALTGQDAAEASIGGAPGARYDGTLPNGLKVTSLVGLKQDIKLVMMSRGPASDGHARLSGAFAKGVEQFQWSLPAPPVQTGQPTQP